MDEIRKRTRQELQFRPAEDTTEGRIDSQEISFRIGNAQHVMTDSEELIMLGARWWDIKISTHEQEEFE